MKLGIIGLGHIAHRVAQGIQYAKNAQLYAVASRCADKAETFKNTYGADIAYSDYETMLKDTNVEMVYICTPNMLHKEHIMQALSHHKHVICEKPFVSSMEQLKECFTYARKQNCFLMEAEKTLFTPLNQQLKKMIDDGVIGKIRYIEAGYGADMKFSDDDMQSWLFRKEDGGSFYDVGVYPICYANYFADASLRHVQIMKRCALTGCDLMAQGMLSYENGVMGYVRSSWNMDFDNRAIIYGERGHIVTENFWKNREAFITCGDETTTIQVEMKSDFTGEIEHAVECAEAGMLQSLILGEKQSEEIMKVLMEMHDSVCV